jgi:NhaA family Na+:H+ antiporter
VIGKPLGISLASWLAIRSGLARAPEGVTLGPFLGAACLCGVSDTVALLMADQAFLGPNAAIAKIGVLVGSILAALLGTIVLVTTAGTNSTPPAPASQ